MFKIKNKKGMTLIEVVVLIAIVGIMSAISIVSFTTSRRNVALDAAAEDISAVLREAQNYSLTGKELTSSCNLYVVDVTPVGTANYSLRNGTCFNYSYSLKNGVIISFGTDTTFAAPHANNNAPATWKRITVSKDGVTRSICINSAGLIVKSVDTTCP